MISIYKTDNIKNTENGKLIAGELRGLSTETKPTSIGDVTIDNGSVFVEIDTQKLYFFDADSQEWKGD